MTDERKLVTARDLPATIAEAPPPKRDSAEIHKFAQVANINADHARRILESKDGRMISAIAKGMAPEISRFVHAQMGPLLARIAELERKLDKNLQAVKEAAQTRDEWEAAFRDGQRLTKTIKTRRDEDGRLVADVFEGDGATSLKYKGTWDATREYAAGDFCTDRGSMFCALVLTRSRPGSNNNDWQLAVKRGRDGKDAR